MFISLFSCVNIKKRKVKIRNDHTRGYADIKFYLTTNHKHVKNPVSIINRNTNSDSRFYYMNDFYNYNENSSYNYYHYGLLILSSIGKSCVYLDRNLQQKILYINHIHTFHNSNMFIYTINTEHLISTTFSESKKVYKYYYSHLRLTNKHNKNSAIYKYSIREVSDMKPSYLNKKLFVLINSKIDKLLKDTENFEFIIEDIKNIITMIQFTQKKVTQIIKEHSYEEIDPQTIRYIDISSGLISNINDNKIYILITFGIIYFKNIKNMGNVPYLVGGKIFGITFVNEIGKNNIKTQIIKHLFDRERDIYLRLKNKKTFEYIEKDLHYDTDTQNILSLIRNKYDNKIIIL